MTQKHMKRLYDVKSFTRFLNDALTHLDDMRSASKNGVDRQFGERIMLAVTEVNGCRYCNYFHARQALEAGVSSSEVDQLLSGEIAAAPEEQQVAMLFAQHYAESAGYPDPEALEKLQDTYGSETARGIIAYIRMIMIGNVYGNAFDALRHRLIGKPAAGSTLGQELGVLLSVVVTMPWIMIRGALQKRSLRRGAAVVET